MRASRLLRILLILQNRGRLTAARLADELEVSSRTILRDVDAMTEAGLPIIVHQGNQGGIELGFNYRTRLTGLDRDEACALGLILATGNPVIAALGLTSAAARARTKLLESLPDTVRDAATGTAARFLYDPSADLTDPRISAMARAVQNGLAVHLRTETAGPIRIGPVALAFDADGWTVRDALSGTCIALTDWGDVNISGLPFADLTPGRPGPMKPVAPKRRNSDVRTI